MTEQRDLYEVLGVDADAGREAIVHAYRRQVHESHPDTRPADPAAAERFHQLTAAYDVLADPDRRRTYDQQHGLNQPRSEAPTRRATPQAMAVIGGAAALAVGPVHVEPPPLHPDAVRLSPKRLNAALTVGPTEHIERR